MIPSILQPMRAWRPCEFRPKSYRRKSKKAHRVECEAKKPQPIEGAQWQAGVTPDNELYRVTLDGVPCPLALAASEFYGWVMCYEERESGLASADALPGECTVEYLAAPRKVYGKVRIVRGE